MGDIVTLYPTKNLPASRTAKDINDALFAAISSIPGISDFFRLTKADSTDSYQNAYFDLQADSAKLRIRMYNSGGGYNVCNYSANSTTYNSGNTLNTMSDDMPVRYAVGIGGTVAVWLDNYNKNVWFAYNKYGTKSLIANGSSSSSYSCYYSDTNGVIKNLPAAFNFGNKGNMTELIAYVYYHLGENTKDIYTFDGGITDLPCGKFAIGKAEFVRLGGNFALRIK